MNIIKFKFFLLVLVQLLLLSSSHANTKETQLLSINKPTKIGFVENQGQILDIFDKPCNKVKYNLRSNGINISLSEDGIHFFQTQNLDTKKKQLINKTDDSSIINKYRTYRIDFLFKNHNKNIIITKDGKSEDFENHYVNKRNGKISISNLNYYSKIKYENIYNNIDFIIYVNEGKIEYDFVVNPGGNVSDIQIEIRNATNIEVNNEKLNIVITYQITQKLLIV